MHTHQHALLQAVHATSYKQHALLRGVARLAACDSNVNNIFVREPQRGGLPGSAYWRTTRFTLNSNELWWEGWRGGWRGLRCESTLVNASCAAATWQPAGLVTSRVTRLHGASAIVATYGLYPPLLASRAAGPQFEIARRVEVLYCYLRQPCSWSSSMGQQNMITHA